MRARSGGRRGWSGVRCRRVVAAIGIVGACSLGPQEAGAAAVEVGSWWQAQTGAVPATVPPTVLPGTAWVASAANGPTAMSAIRFKADPSRPLPELIVTLRTAQPNALGPIAACVTTSPWQPVTAGVWSSRPTFDCSKGRAQGITSLDNKTMTFDLALIESTGDVDLVLVPTEVSPPVPQPAGFVPGAPALPTYYNTFDITTEPIQVPDVAAPPAARPPVAAPAAPATEPAPQAPAVVDIARSFSPSLAAPTTAPPTTGAARVTVRPAQTAAPELQPVAATQPEHRPSWWRAGIAVLLIAVGLERSRSRPDLPPLGGLRTPAH
jgi:hypothetical protein